MTMTIEKRISELGQEDTFATGNSTDEFDASGEEIWSAFWRTGDSENPQVRMLPGRVPDVARSRLLDEAVFAIDGEIRIRASSAAKIWTFHTTLADLAQWSTSSDFPLRCLRTSEWIEAIRRERNLAAAEDAFIRVFADAVESGLWSHGTMRETLDYCMLMLTQPRARWTLFEKNDRILPN